MELPLAAGWYEDSVKPIAAQECVNWIPQVPETNAYNKAQLVGTAGISEFSNTGSNNNRGFHNMGGIAYSVNGAALLRTSENGSVANLGAITGTGKVSIADNGTQMCIVVPGGDAYIYSVVDGLEVITDSNFVTTLGPSQQVIFKDTYFLHFNNNSNASARPIFFKSAGNDGRLFNALDFSDAETDPDEITGIHNNKNQLYVGGKQTIELFQNIGGADFPYQRVQGGVIQKGVKAKFSMQDFDNGFVFVGSGENEKIAIWRAFGSGSPVKISTPAIDNVLQNLNDINQTELYATTHSENGEFFYTIHTPTRTFSYLANASARFGKNTWIERKSKDVDGILVSWRVSSIIEAYGRLLVADIQGGLIGELDKNINSEYQDSIQRIVTTQPFTNDLKDLAFSVIELVCLTGTNNATKIDIDQLIFEPYTDGDYSDDYTADEAISDFFDVPGASVMRSFSDDGGYTFSPQTSRSLGEQGERNIRQMWRREGQTPRNRIYRFVIDSDIDVSIIKLMAA